MGRKQRRSSLGGKGSSTKKGRRSMSASSTPKAKTTPFRNLTKKISIVNPFKKTPKNKTPAKTAKSPRFNLIGSSTPRSGGKKQRGRVFDQPKPDSPRVFVEQLRHGQQQQQLQDQESQQHQTNENCENISDDEVEFEIVERKRKRKSSGQLPTPTNVNKRQKKFQAQPSYIPLQSAAKSAETLTITINDDTLELTDEEQQQKRTVTINQVVDRPDSPEIIILAEKPAEKNPQSLFNRWNIPGLLTRSVKSVPEKKGISASTTTSKQSRFAWSKKKRDNRNDRRKNINHPNTTNTNRADVRQNLTNSHSNLTVPKTMSQINEEAQRSKNTFYAGPPVFDPNQPPVTNFTPAADSAAPGQVFPFNATAAAYKQNFPKMGVGLSKTRLRAPSPTNVTSSNVPNLSDVASAGSSNAPRAGIAQPVFYNIIDAGRPVLREGLRPIIIDGSNVACAHGEASCLGTGRMPTGPLFSSRGIEICVEYFRYHGFKSIIAFVPQHRFKTGQAKDVQILHNLKSMGYLQVTPDKSYDDRIFVQYASLKGGVVVSRDSFKDLMNGNPAIEDTIKNRKLAPTFIEDVLIFPDDPLGKGGPDLATFLRFN